mmetsp:Transcript_20637/g.57579  ORF Transcript_20637/g.57579 Transcript_20637/m.57579 type:complete len:141 (+) Transcript_20637:90-512(+)
MSAALQGGTPQARKLLELEQTMVKELRQQNFEKALEAANTVLAHNPDDKRGQEFSKLLQELIARREEDTESSSGSETESGDVEGSDQARGAGSKDDEERSSSSSSSSNRQGSNVHSSSRFWRASSQALASPPAELCRCRA